MGRCSLSLWLRWVGANALAEMVGLGATFALDALILARVASMPGIAASLLGIVMVAATGAIEGTIVGAVHGLAPVRLTNWQ
jgi:hypothetical protein